MEDNFRKVAPLITIPFALALPPLVGGWIGVQGDRFFHTSPYGMYGLIFLGFIGGIRETIRIIKRFSNDSS